MRETSAAVEKEMWTIDETQPVAMDTSETLPMPCGPELTCSVGTMLQREDQERQQIEASKAAGARPDEKLAAGAVEEACAYKSG